MGTRGHGDVSDQAFAGRLLSVGPELVRLAMSILDDSSLAEDAVAGAYLKAWEKRGTLRADGKLDPWLKRICRNCALDLRRQRLRDPVQYQPEALEHACDESALDGLSREELLGRLPDKLKNVARMRFVDDMGYSQIAEIERLPTSTVRGRIHLAREHLRREIEMTAQHEQPKSDAWDDGVVRPSPDGVVRWRGIKVRMLGTWRPGQNQFYGPSGRRLSRVPSAVRKSRVFAESERIESPRPAEHILVFFQMSGGPGYTYIRGCRTSSEGADSRLAYSLMPIDEANAVRRRIRAGLVGDVVDDEDAAVRFLSDFTSGCSVTAIPGWGAVFVFVAQPGQHKGTCSLSLVYSSAVVESDWATVGLTDDDREIPPDSVSQAASACNEGDVTGLVLVFPVAPERVKGVVFRPRWHAEADWGSIAMPPAARTGKS